MKTSGPSGKRRNEAENEAVGQARPAQQPQDFPDIPAIPDGPIPESAWFKEFPGGVTVCNADGIITGMNDQSAIIFEEDGGRALLGKNVFDCHPEPARTQLIQMVETRQRNVYTIEKNGIKKLIYQSPWYQNGAYAGFIELSLEIPFELPHFVRG